MKLISLGIELYYCLHVTANMAVVKTTYCYSRNYIYRPPVTLTRIRELISKKAKPDP